MIAASLKGIKIPDDLIKTKNKSKDRIESYKEWLYLIDLTLDVEEILECIKIINDHLFDGLRPEVRIEPEKSLKEKLNELQSQNKKNVSVQDEMDVELEAGEKEKFEEKIKLEWN